MDLDSIRDALEGKIGFQGQRLADRINQETIVMVSILAFAAGWFLQNLSLCIYIYVAGLFAALIACVPPWPMYKRNPVVWLPPRPKSEDKKKQ